MSSWLAVHSPEHRKAAEEIQSACGFVRVADAVSWVERLPLVAERQPLLTSDALTGDVFSNFLSTDELLWPATVEASALLFLAELVLLEGRICTIVNDGNISTHSRGNKERQTHATAPSFLNYVRRGTLCKGG